MHDKFKIMIVFDVFYVFNFFFIFLFVKIFDRKDFRNIFDEKNCRIIHKKSDQLIIVEINFIDIDFYRFVFANDILIEIYVNVYHVIIESKQIIIIKIIDINVVHVRMKHFNENYFRHLIFVLKDFQFKNIFKFCEKCALIKQIKRNHI